ncbi:hypothetical protein Vretifemale_16465 [Volvox reticuliferus]|uniref:Glycosyl transferase CAP10 domain-containing protein n=1 Tax=Volvox reticuliferus TaxID=1737510 RepID=A0A8J4FXP6_9CHLO|nr:hypothetical protein Vretifemale_16465 [Volvox reticuliferus]
MASRVTQPLLWITVLLLAILGYLTSDKVFIKRTNFVDSMGSGFGEASYLDFNDSIGTAWSLAHTVVADADLVLLASPARVSKIQSFSLKNGKHRNCLADAQGIEEPFTERYQPRTSSFQLTSPIWGHVRRASWEWGSGDISREDFEAGMRNKHIIHYKLVGGRLFLNTSCSHHAVQKSTEEIIKFTLYMFPTLPDMEFLFYPGDDCNFGFATIKFNYCRDPTKRGGFALPVFDVWDKSTGPTQMGFYHACLDAQYPPHHRIPRVVWRGASNNPFTVTGADFYMSPRYRLHQLGLEHPDILDAKLTSLRGDFLALPVEVVTALNNTLGNHMTIEDFNRYCGILDVDGNAWAGRFGHSFMHYPTPTIKMETQYATFWDTLFAPGYTHLRFPSHMGTLVALSKKVIVDCISNGAKSHGQEIVARMRKIARAYFDHVGIAEAMAYTLLTYRNLTTWRLDPSLEGFTEVKVPNCCEHVRLPQAVVDAMTMS